MAIHHENAKLGFGRRLARSAQKHAENQDSGVAAPAERLPGGSGFGPSDSLRLRMGTPRGWSEKDSSRGSPLLATLLTTPFVASLSPQGRLDPQASTIQDMLVRMLKEHPNSVSGIMERPVFLDIEDLKDLSDLKRHVARSHNIVLLLTPGVLTRPWCLLEIVTAIRHKAHVLPVRVEEPGVGFEFPDDAWYERLLAGKILDRSCAKFLQSEGIDAADLEKACVRLCLGRPLQDSDAPGPEWRATLRFNSAATHIVLLRDELGGLRSGSHEAPS